MYEKSAFKKYVETEYASVFLNMGGTLISRVEEHRQQSTIIS